MEQLSVCSALCNFCYHLMFVILSLSFLVRHPHLPTLASSGEAHVVRHHCTPSFVEAATTPSVHHDLYFPTTAALPPIVSSIAERTRTKSRVWHRCLSRRSWYERRSIGTFQFTMQLKMIHYSCVATADVQPSTLNPTADCATP